MREKYILNFLFLSLLVNLSLAYTCTIVSIPCLIYDTLVSSLENGNNAAIRDYIGLISFYREFKHQVEKLDKEKVLDYVMDVAVPLITDAIEEDSNIDVGKLVDELVSDSLLQVRIV